jgi:hypothetical protein
MLHISYTPLVFLCRLNRGPTALRSASSSAPVSIAICPAVFLTTPNHSRWYNYSRAMDHMDHGSRDAVRILDQAHEVLTIGETNLLEAGHKNY